MGSGVGEGEAGAYGQSDYLVHISKVQVSHGQIVRCVEDKERAFTPGIRRIGWREFWPLLVSIVSRGDLMPIGSGEPEAPNQTESEESELSSVRDRNPDSWEKKTFTGRHFCRNNVQMTRTTRCEKVHT